MKKYLYLLAVMIAVLSRLPHPARDISKLDPVQVIYLNMEAGDLGIRTDTGDAGVGPDLSSAAEVMRAAADREIYLETAQYLILSPEVTITPEFYALLRPSARVCYGQNPDLEAAADWLAIHPPKLTLARVRAEAGKEAECKASKPLSGS